MDLERMTRLGYAVAPFGPLCWACDLAVQARWLPPRCAFVAHRGARTLPGRCNVLG